MLSQLGRITCLIILSSTALAGCLDDGANEVDSKSPGQSTELAQSLAAADGQSPWTVITAAAQPNGTVAAFHWEAPADALVRDQYFDDWWWMYLEVVPLYTSTPPTSWSLAIFDEGSTTELLSLTLAEPMDVRTRTPLPEADSQQGVLVDPFYSYLIFDGSRPPMLGFVLTVVGVDEFGLALRPLAQEPTGQPSITQQDILDAGAPELPAPAGSGTGVNVAFYLDVNLAALLGIEAWTQSVVVEDRLPNVGRPVVTARDVTLSTSFEGPGWSYGAGLYVGYEAHGVWEAAVDSRGQSIDARSVILEDLAPPAVWAVEALAVGLPFYFFQGEGPEGSSSSFRLLTTNVDVLEIMLFLQYDLGASLSDLLGRPGAQEASAFTGILGNIPPVAVRADNGHLDVFTHGGPTLTVLSPAIQLA